MDEYYNFLKSLHIGDEFTAVYIDDINCATLGKSMTKRRFEIVKVFRYVMQVRTYKHITRNGIRQKIAVLCWVNVKDFYTKGTETVIYPCRLEAVND